MVTAAPKLYPHQWSWDAALISIGLAHMSIPRALRELENLFRAQWSTGMIPHIVFSDVPGYFPGPDVWSTDTVPAKPHDVRTSGICQPPVHAIAVARILDLAVAKGGEDRRLAEDFARTSLDRLVAWHQWLMTVRDPSGLDLVEIHHGWESGMDNSPRWDEAYANVVVPEPIPMARHDIKVVGNIEDRPTDREYQRYLQLMREMASVNFDDAQINDVVQFRITDVFLTAVLALACDETARLAELLGREDVADGQRALADRARRGVLSCVSPDTGRCRDFDVRAGQWVDVPTIASWSVLVSGGDDAVWADHRAALVGEHWAGHPSLRFPLPPTVSPDDPGFRPRTYWRGPTWPFLNWLLTWALARRGDRALAATWRDATLELLGDGAFGEYYDPQTGQPAGSHDQSWTAAVAIDWIAGRAQE
ncbi:glycogen debranching protein [Raineyella fluvialis]|uniref:Glycogen debranching protein n=2 Tax=Raineyella fluvialis TaxID=2662261 RepID=A0A5Q2FJ86_9ACTN|nr:glycogen debranching protein [Raineyella fluvialis]